MSQSFAQNANVYSLRGDSVQDSSKHDPYMLSTISVINFKSKPQI